MRAPAVVLGTNRFGLCAQTGHKPKRFGRRPPSEPTARAPIAARFLPSVMQ
jgi:hypothetical protein